MLRRFGDDASYSHVRLTRSLHLSPSLPLAQTHKHTHTCRRTLRQFFSRFPSVLPLPRDESSGECPGRGKGKCQPPAQRMKALVESIFGSPCIQLSSYESFGSFLLHVLCFLHFPDHTDTAPKLRKRRQGSLTPGPARPSPEFREGPRAESAFDRTHVASFHCMLSAS